MTDELKLMMVLAHPDDESLGNGGTLAKYAAEHVKTYLVTATRGEKGWFSDPASYPGAEELGRIREAELRSAADALGLQEVSFLGYVDGEFDKADPTEVIGKLVAYIRRVRPQVVVTFDQNGFYGHPDHIAICQFTTAAVAAAADPTYVDPDHQPEYPVSKLYYMAWTQDDVDLYHKAFGELVMDIDGEERRSVPWPNWSITTRIDASDHWRVAWEAISRHQTQLPGYEKLLALPESDHIRMWGTHLYYRVFTRVPVRSRVESDLFEGLRDGRDAAGMGGDAPKADRKNDNWLVSEIRRITAPVGSTA